MCGRLNFMHVIPNVAAEAFTNQTIRSKFLTCQILSFYKWTSSGEFILNFSGAWTDNPYETCCSCKDLPKYGSKIPKLSSESEAAISLFPARYP